MIFLLIGLFVLAAGLAAAAARQSARAQAADAARQAADQARQSAELARQHAELRVSAEQDARVSEQVARLAEQARKADREATAGELKARTEEIKQAVAPIAEHLRTVQEKVAVLDKEHKGAAAGVGQMVRSVADELGKLRTETSTLVNALKRPQVRGAWGEMALHSCAKAANMVPHVDFHDQRTIGDEATGRLRPDMTVHLPSEAEVVVDSKVPLDAYLAALEAQDERLRDAELDRHARQVRSHIDKLASKAYHAAVGG